MAGERVGWLRDRYVEISEAIDGIVLGKPMSTKLAMTCVLAPGHLLIEDVPEAVGLEPFSKARRALLGVFNQGQAPDPRIACGHPQAGGSGGLGCDLGQCLRVNASRSQCACRGGNELSAVHVCPLEGRYQVSLDIGFRGWRARKKRLSSPAALPGTSRRRWRLPGAAGTGAPGNSSPA